MPNEAGRPFKTRRLLISNLIQSSNNWILCEKLIREQKVTSKIKKKKEVNLFHSENNRKNMSSQDSDSEESIDLDAELAKTEKGIEDKKSYWRR